MEIRGYQSNEKGMVLLTCLLVLFVLTLAGIYVINTARIETEIAGNIKAYKKTFYKTEHAVRLMALSLKNTPDNDIVNNSKVILPDGTPVNSALQGISIKDPDDVLQARLGVVRNSLPNVDVGDSKVKILNGGAAQGESLTIGGSHHDATKMRFFIFANNKPAGISGRGTLIEVGYLRKVNK